jgi:bifunctional non-homologous end joining protein LigD
VRVFTRRGHDWTARFPGIARAAAKLGAKSFTLDGEAVVCGEDGIGIFDALCGTTANAALQAFDLLELNSKDQRPLPLSERRAKLERLLDGATVGIVFNEHTDEDAPWCSCMLVKWASKGSFQNG